MKTSALILALFTLSTTAAANPVFDKPDGKPIYKSKTDPSACDSGDSAGMWDVHCSDRPTWDHPTIYNETFWRVSVDGGAGDAWNTQNGSQGALRLSMRAMREGWSESPSGGSSYFDPAGGYGYMLQAAGRLNVQGLDGLPLYQVHIDATATGRGSLVPIGGLYIALDADTFNRFSQSIARAGYAQSLNFRVGHTGYVLLRYAYTVGRGGLGTGPGTGGDLKQAIANYDRAPTESQPFPNGLSQTGDFNESAHQISAVLQLAKFALNIEVLYGHDHSLRNSPESSSAPGEFNPTEAVRFDAHAALVFPLALLFPNDSLQVEGRYVSLSFEGDNANPDKNVQTSDGMFGVFYGLSW